ncbi:MAG: Ig-like domain-containing protein [Promethearchaeota archaeon]
MHLTLSDGVNYWRVRACDEAENWGDWSNIWTFEIDATPPNTPTLFSPIDDAVTNDPNPSFSWESIIDAEEYQIQIDDSATCSSPLQDNFISVSSHTALSLTDGNYYWRVRSCDIAGNWGDWSNIWSFEIDFTAPDIPILITPETGNIFNIPTIVFDWQDVIEAVQYNLQIDDDFEYTASLYDFTIEESQHTFDEFTSGEYFWRVRASDAAGNWGVWSESRSFEIDIPSEISMDEKPQLLFPLNNSIIQNNLISFNWTDVEGAEIYNLQVSNVQNFQICDDIFVSSLNYSNFLFDDEGNYFWRVCGQDSYGNPGLWSDVGYLTIDWTPPGIPELISPIDGDEFQTCFVTFNWEETSDTSFYQIEIDTALSFSTENLIVEQMDTNTILIELLIPESIYFWRVRACDEAENWGDWSSIQYINLVLPEIPPEIILLSPEEDAILNHFFDIDLIFEVSLPHDFTQFWYELDASGIWIEISGNTTIDIYDMGNHLIIISGWSENFGNITSTTNEFYVIVENDVQIDFKFESSCQDQYSVNSPLETKVTIENVGNLPISKMIIRIQNSYDGYYFDSQEIFYELEDLLPGESFEFSLILYITVIDSEISIIGNVICDYYYSGLSSEVTFETPDDDPSEPDTSSGTTDDTSESQGIGVPWSFVTILGIGAIIFTLQRKIRRPRKIKI